MAAFPEPEDGRTDVAELFVVYLDFFRATVEEKLRGLDDRQLRTSRLPSGWTPLGLLVHLVHVERRWLQWGFLGEHVTKPWGDQDDDGRWRVATDETLDTLLARLQAVGARTSSIVAGSALLDVAAPGGRFGADDRPALVRILFHLVQEYARHVGHLDVVRELADGSVGE